MLLYFLPRLVSTLILIGCNSAHFLSAHPAISGVNQTDAMSRSIPLSEASLNKRITIRGTAQNASLGAIVITEEETPVYINGIQEWDSYIVGKPIIVTGTLRRKSLAPKAILSPNGEVSHGIDGKSYVLDNSKWKFDRRR